MVFRTSVIDSFNASVTRQMATPEMRADFPMWEYLGLDDGRAGDDHRPKFGRFYPASATFAEVRGRGRSTAAARRSPFTSPSGRS
jgi:hypothetical protein